VTEYPSALFPAIDARAETTVTPAPFIFAATPETSVRTTLSLRSTTFAWSIDAPDTVTPNASECAEVKLRGIEKSFRGNAALVQANASESALLEEDHFHSAVGGALGGIVSAGTSADYGKIVFHMLYRALDKASFLYLWYGERAWNGHGNGLGNLLKKGSLNLQNLSN